MAKVVRILDDLYGPEVWEGPRNPLDTLILTILSQSTSDDNRDRAYASLRRRFPDWEQVVGADVGAIAEAIRVGGLANQKAGNIRDLLIWLKAERGTLSLDFLCGMDSGEALALLLPRRGIGVKTVFVTLMFACGKDVFPVDTHIHRIAGRLGLIPEACTAERAHDLLALMVPEGKGLSLHVNMLEFGRRVCHARNPECDRCPLRRRACVYIRREA